MGDGRRTGDEVPSLEASSRSYFRSAHTAVLAAFDAVGDGNDPIQFVGADFLPARAGWISPKAFHDFQISNDARECGNSDA